MKKIRIIFLIVIGVIILGLGVRFYIYKAPIVEKNVKKETLSSKEKDETVITSTQVEPEKDKYSLSVIIGSRQVGIDDKEKDVNLSGLLGKPLSEKIEVSGPEAFPYAGISFKTIEYEGLIISFYGSKDGSYRIGNIKVNNEKFPTTLGIKVGDSIERLQEVYPVENNEELYGPGVYSLYGDKTGWGMFFHTSDNKITSIEINAEWD